MAGHHSRVSSPEALQKNLLGIKSFVHLHKNQMTSLTHSILRSNVWLALPEPESEILTGQLVDVYL